MESPDGLYLERCERNILSYESAILNTCLLVFLRLSPVPNLIHIVTRRSGACITPLSVINDVFFFTLYLGVVIVSKGQSSAIECVGLSTAWGRHPPRELVGWQAFCALIEIPQIGVLWLTAMGYCAVIFQFPPSPKPFFYEGRVLLIISTLLSTLFLFLAIDVASFQQVEGPNDRWAGEFYAALVYKFLLSLSSLYALARLVPTFYTTVDAGPHSRWSMLGLGVEACALLLQGTAMGMRKFEAPFRLDLEVDMSRVERIMYTTQMVLPLGMLAGRKIVMLVKVSRMKWGQRTAVIGSNIEAGEEADESTSLLHDA